MVISTTECGCARGTQSAYKPVQRKRHASFVFAALNVGGTWNMSFFSLHNLKYLVRPVSCWVLGAIGVLKMDRWFLLTRCRAGGLTTHVRGPNMIVARGDVEDVCLFQPLVHHPSWAESLQHGKDVLDVIHTCWASWSFGLSDFWRWTNSALINFTSFTILLGNRCAVYEWIYLGDWLWKLSALSIVPTIPVNIMACPRWGPKWWAVNFAAINHCETV